MPKVFAAGHIVQFADNKYAIKDNPDGYVIVSDDVQDIFAKKWEHIPTDVQYVIGLNNGMVRCANLQEENVNHCIRTKGVVKPKGKPKEAQDYPKKATMQIKPVCKSKNPQPDPYEPGGSWSLKCEREKGHPGDHMAWKKYPHEFYKGGVWANDENVDESAAEVNPNTEISVTFDNDDIPF